MTVEELIELAKNANAIGEKLQELNEKLQALEGVIDAKFYLSNKGVLTADEAAVYCGLSRREITRKVSERQIRASRPGGKILYIDRADLEEWMRSNPIATDAEIETEVKLHLAKNRKSH